LVSDAGTPLISDPGSRLVSAAIGAGFDVIPIPGASALLAALVVSGLPSDRFTFFGFIPRKGGDRQVFLREIAASAHSSVLYESPQRVGALLEDLCDLAGPERAVAVARELTKMHEECYRATLGEAVVHFRDRQVKGEIVVVVSPNPEPAAGPDEGAARALADALLARGLSPSAIARELRDRLYFPRNDAYRLAQDIAGQTD